MDSDKKRAHDVFYKPIDDEKREKNNEKLKKKKLSMRNHRIDDVGVIIKYTHYGQDHKESPFNWEIDHIIPQNPPDGKHGGSDEISNLRPLWSKANNKKGNRIITNSELKSELKKEIAQNKIEQNEFLKKEAKHRR